MIRAWQSTFVGELSTIALSARRIRGDAPDRYIAGEITCELSMVAFVVLFPNKGTAILLPKFDDIQVIGNIYENPELVRLAKIRSKGANQ
jgi:hypothetical protein